MSRNLLREASTQKCIFVENYETYLRTFVSQVFFFKDQAVDGAVEDNLKCRKALARLYITAYFSLSSSKLFRCI